MSDNVGRKTFVNWILHAETKYLVLNETGRRMAEGRTKREAVIRGLAAANRRGVPVRIVEETAAKTTLGK